jgi:hypothetical protein
MTGWQDIETAPRGVRILADVVFNPPHRYYGARRVEMGSFDGLGWCGEGVGGEPVGWMLPPPSADSLTGEGWIEWSGGPNPVPGAMVDAELGHGTFINCLSDIMTMFWRDAGRYRLSTAARGQAGGDFPKENETKPLPLPPVSKE